MRTDKFFFLTKQKKALFLRNIKQTGWQWSLSTLCGLLYHILSIPEDHSTRRLSCPKYMMQGKYIMLINLIELNEFHSNASVSRHNWAKRSGQCSRSPLENYPESSLLRPTNTASRYDIYIYNFLFINSSNAMWLVKMIVHAYVLHSQHYANIITVTGNIRVRCITQTHTDLRKCWIPCARVILRKHKEIYVKSFFVTSFRVDNKGLFVSMFTYL